MESDPRQSRSAPTRADVVIVGGGHNGLVSAAYLARAGRQVTVLERGDVLGGAAISSAVFAGVDAKLSRYAYLVSLLPDQIVAELGIAVRCASRRVSSFTPVGGGAGAGAGATATGLFVGRGDAERQRTAASFTSLTGSEREWERWQSFYGRIARAAQRLAPTLLEPLCGVDELRRVVDDDETWRDLFEAPIAEVIEREFTHDVVRGVVLTDALIGTFTDGHDLDANRCFLYHVIGNGDGEWKVPIGGMGVLASELTRVALAAGARIVTGAEVLSIDTDGHHADVRYRHGDDEVTLGARHVLVNASPRELARLRLGAGSSTLVDRAVVEGCQIKVNMLLERLPRLRCGVDARDAFAGTFHLDESYDQLTIAHGEASRGLVPSVVPGELYCHSLSDPSILGPELVARGCHTLTLFGLHLPATLFDADNDGVTAEVVRRLIAGLDAHLDEPLSDCLVRDVEGRPCIEAHSPLDLDHELGLPRGNIFHRPLRWPYAEDVDDVGRWGVETGDDNVWLCGAGARRGGGVSGIPGRNAAMAVLQRTAN
ncbi:MAG: phytoene desaturase family protein [Acidimicrobiia bacterium]